MPNQLASIRGRLEDLLRALEQGQDPDRLRLENTLTDGYAWALKLDAECARLERSIGSLASELDHANGEQHARELSQSARRLARSKRELAALRGLLGELRAEAAEAKIA